VFYRNFFSLSAFSLKKGVVLIRLSHKMILFAFLISGVCFSSPAQADVRLSFVNLKQKDRPKVRTAITEVLDNEPLCKNVGDYYFSIGDRHGVLLKGYRGQSQRATTPVKYASASKWIFSALALEMKKGRLNWSLISGLNFTSGFTRFKVGACSPQKTLGDCFQQRDFSKRNRNEFAKFNYHPGHMLKLASRDLGMADHSLEQMDRQIKRNLGRDLNMNFSNFNPAGAIRGDAHSYERFLKRLTNGDYYLSDQLGQYSVCADAKKCRDTVVYSLQFPGQNWDYSLGHWVEGAGESRPVFSSPGAHGFYPWIDSSSNHWGVFSRQTKGSGGARGSVGCGQKIREAFMKSMGLD
jgi:hypothetical protein